MSRRHEVVESETVFRGTLLEVLVEKIRLPDGRVSRREIVRHPGAVAVIALREGEVLLVRQNRHAVGQDLLELPAGKIDPGEDPETCARRELEEETGYRASSFEVLGSFFTTPGFSDERIWIFMTEDLIEAGPPPAHDEGEPLEVRWMPFQDAMSAISSGEIKDSKTIIGLYLASGRLGS